MSDVDRSELEAAIATAREAPESEESWDAVEDLAAELEAPDDVAALFREILDRDLSVELTEMIGQRAAGFFEEWYGDDPSKLAGVLTRILELDAKADWAFQRLTLSLTESQDWDRLLAIYDRVIGGAEDLGRQVQLLEEASQVARDMADNTEKAIDYLQRLIPLKPEDDKLAPSLEKLLEKHERWGELVELLAGRLEEMEPEERLESRGRIATYYLDRLDNPEAALEAAKDYLAEVEDDAPACALVERILTHDSSTDDVRSRALDVLRFQFESKERPLELVRVLERAIEVDSTREMTYRGEAAQLLSEHGQLEAAMAHYAAMLLIDPSSAATVGQLRQLAQRSQNFELFADGVVKAAEKTDDPERRVALLAAGARARLEALEDQQAAIELFMRALDTPDISPADVLYVGRKANELLANTDRHSDRLNVLRRLAEAETIEATRKTLLGDIAKLSEHLGDSETALSAWRSRLELDATDQVALDSAVTILEREENWQALAETLEKRLEGELSPDERRFDLMRLARLYGDRLYDDEKSLATWSRFRNEFGDNDEVIASMASLLGRAQQWQQLAEVLSRWTDSQKQALLNHFATLADAYRDQLDAPGRALDYYDAILRIDPHHEQASNGLSALLEVESCKDKAIDILATNYRNTDNWSGVLGLVETRLAAATETATELAILREAATLHEARGEDPAAALSCLARAFPLAPRDGLLERELVRLAEVADDWSTAQGAYAAAVDAVAGDDNATLDLCGRFAALLEEHGDQAGALARYQQVFALDASSYNAATAIVRLAKALGQLDEAARAMIKYACTRGRLDTTHLETIAADVSDGEAVAAAQSAIEGAVSQSNDEVPAATRSTLLRKFVGWQREINADAAAELELLERILAIEPDDRDILERVAELRRDQPDASLYRTLRQLSELDPNNLDLRWELAEVALEQLDDGSEIERALSGLLTRAAAAWRGTAPATGERNAEEAVSWALEVLGRRFAESGRADAAFELLVDAARMPFPEQKQRSLRVRAATVASEELGDSARATDMYKAILAQAPDDAETLTKLGDLYRAQERHAELLNLCQHELSLDPEPERRLHLRLEVARLVGEIERRVARVDALKQNLDEAPGHRESVDFLDTILAGQGEFEQLADILTDQATRLESGDEAARAAELWLRVADIAENKLKDLRRAIAAHKRIVTVAPSAQSFEALAVLHNTLGEPDQALPWLERLVEITNADQSELVLKLARAQIEVNQRERAISFLARTRADGDRNPEIRRLLAKLYRHAEMWEPLADLLSSALDEVDEETANRLARTAADLYQNKLGDPERALPSIDRALQGAPDDRDLKIMRSKALRAAGRLDEARESLGELIADFGRRRSKERAALHVDLAYVLRAQEEYEAALKEIELASKMDAGNPQLLREVAAMALAGGNLDKAEKSLRSLLLVVRRNPSADDLESVGESEVLYELHRLSAQRDEVEKTAELLESAVEAALQSDAEVMRLVRTLLSYEDIDVALRALEGRIEVSDEPASKATLLSQLAELLEKHKDRAADGLARRIEALELTPENVDLHEQTIEAARSTGQISEYVERVSDMLSTLKRDEDSNLAGVLYMKLGALCENDLDDLDSARKHYATAIEAGADRADALFAMARTASKAGDTDAVREAIDQLTEIVDGDEPSATQANALYQLAELQIDSYELRSRGIELLKRALSVDPQPERAARILCAALDAEPDDAEIVGIYEGIARGSGDPAMLLDFLERRAKQPSASAKEIREAVDLARSQGFEERANALLDRAVDAARRSDAGIGSAIWAVTALIEQRLDGQLRGARDLLIELLDVDQSAETIELGCRVAGAGISDDTDLSLAAEVLERMRAFQPTSREIWEPLVDIYRRTGDSTRFLEVMNSTLPSLMDPDERNALRRQMARFLIDSGAAQEAVEPLRDALLDNPDDLESAGLLESVLRDSGDSDALSDFLWQRYEDARERGNAASLEDVALRLGTVLEEAESPEASTVYRGALEAVEDSAPLLRRLFALVAEGQEKAELGERLLAVEEAEQATDLALELARMWTELEDDAGALRVLQLGQRRAPTSPQLRDRLEQHYRSTENWGELASMMVTEAEAIEDPDAAVARFREAVAIYRETLEDLRSAADVMGKAFARNPESVSLAIEWSDGLLAAEDYAGAGAALEQALEQDVHGTERAELLLASARIATSLEDLGAATAALEEAYTLDSERAREPLWQGLTRQREAAAASGARDLERAPTLRLAELLTESGESEQASDLLIGWVLESAEDREALEQLRALDSEHERWHGVVTACARLVMILHGEEQLAAAEQLYQSARDLGDVSYARQGLEFVQQVQPENAAIREYLRSLYEEAGAYRELANLLLVDAEQSEDEEGRYQGYRRAADLLVNQLGDAEAAIQPAQKAQELRPDDHDTVVLLADILTVSGRADEAAAMLEPVIAEHKRRSPELAELQYRMARTAQAVGDYENQLAWLKKAFDVDRKNGVIAAELAQLATELQDYDLALKPLRAISLMDTPGPISRTMALLWEAKIEHARGNRAKAELWAKKALREDPEFMEAQEFLSQIQE